MKETYSDRLKRRSQVMPSGCIEWTGPKLHNGYGKFTVTSSLCLRAHRVAYAEAFGPIPEGMMVMHRCDNRICINPAHLELGTNADNVADRDRKKRGGAGKMTPFLARL